MSMTTSVMKKEANDHSVTQEVPHLNTVMNRKLHKPILSLMNLLSALTPFL